VIRFVLTRLLLLVVGLLVASALIFFTLRILPGDVAQVIAGTQSTPEQVAAIT
jgi:peptide/nickel transport system permease protein